MMAGFTSFSVVKRPTGFWEVMVRVPSRNNQDLSLFHARDIKKNLIKLMISYVFAKGNLVSLDLKTPR